MASDQEYDDAWATWAGCYYGGWQDGDKAISNVHAPYGQAEIEVVVGENGIHRPHLVRGRIIRTMPEPGSEWYWKSYLVDEVHVQHFSNLQRLKS